MWSEQVLRARKKREKGANNLVLRSYVAAFGTEDYMQLRDEYLGHSSITYRFNEANHGGVDIGQRPNCRWFAYSDQKYPRSQLAIKTLNDIKKGEELLVTYTQKQV